MSFMDAFVIGAGFTLGKMVVDFVVLFTVEWFK